MTRCHDANTTYVILVFILYPFFSLVEIVLHITGVLTGGKGLDIFFDYSLFYVVSTVTLTTFVVKNQYLVFCLTVGSSK